MTDDLPEPHKHSSYCPCSRGLETLLKKLRRDRQWIGGKSQRILTQAPDGSGKYYISGSA